MDYVALGSTGLKVSQICLGMMSYGDPEWQPWVLGEAAAEPLVRRAADAGITFFDTADVYSLGASEEITGRLLRRTFSRREEYVLATKVFGRMGDSPNDAGLSRGHILDACDASLRRLGVDHIDLYQLHRFDPQTPAEETMEALDDLVRAGKVRYLGASSMWAWQLAKLQRVADRGGWTPLVSMQNHYNLLYREEEREMLPQLADMGMACLPWSPLARGRLARADRQDDSTARSVSDARADDLYETAEQPTVDHVAEISEETETSPAQVALAWLLGNPTVTAPIVGATQPEHLDDAVAATELQLTESEVGRLEAHYRCQPVREHD